MNLMLYGGACCDDEENILFAANGIQQMICMMIVW
jgi:hypothetical protein